MATRKTKCRVIERTWVTPTVMELLFEPERAFRYDPGQFVSIVVPPRENIVQLFKRMYSLASPFESALKEGFRLCVKFNPGGAGSEYIASLKSGDQIEIIGPFGDFVYHPEPHRNVCFISTGTGIAPLRSMVLSTEFMDQPPPATLFLYGCRTENEILYPELALTPGVQVVNVLSQGSEAWTGFRGRVTDYLSVLPKDWNWHTTDFYICGSPEMARDVTVYLSHVCGVSLEAIHSEVFAAPGANSSEILEEIKKAAA